MKLLLRLMLLETAARLVRTASGDMRSFALIYDHERNTTSITTDLSGRDAELLQDAARRAREAEIIEELKPVGAS